MRTRNRGWWETVPHLGRILIVDDEPKIRSFIGRALDAAGYATESADSGGEGLRRALKSR
jgi:DNA-binding response OmpR family regulator